MFCEKTSVLYQARYCAQEDFSIAVCMKESIKILDHPFSMSNYKNSKRIDLITKRRYNSKTVAYGSNLFVISESRRSCSLEKYSKLNENKIVLPSLLDKR